MPTADPYRRPSKLLHVGMAFVALLTSVVFTGCSHSTAFNPRNRCGAQSTVSPAAGSWTSWGQNLENWRYQSAQSNITAAQIPRLTLKWAFGFPNVKVVRSQPVVYNGRIYAAANDGMFSLDAKAGCTYWATSITPVRSALVLGRAGTATAIFYGDAKGGVSAIDASSGRLLWHTRVDDDPHAILTGAPAYANGRLYIPVASEEEYAAEDPHYACCTFRGLIVALNAQNGSVVWRTFTINRRHDGQQTSLGNKTLLGPSGAAVWSSPTIDITKQRLYITTGNNYSPPVTLSSDAVIALDLNSGQRLWSKQFTSNDATNESCALPEKQNCPASNGPDFDFGASPILVKLHSGRRALLLGQKSGVMYAIDPDAQGEVLWQTRVARGGSFGGILWGPATDGKSIYVAISDLKFTRGSTLRGLQMDPTAGGGVTALRVDNGAKIWSAPAPVCGNARPCSPAQTAAVTAVPGAVFSGSLSGHMRAYDARSGKILWDFNTAQSFDTIDNVKAQGGSLNVSGPVVASGMVFVNSGDVQFLGLPGNVLLAFGPQ